MREAYKRGLDAFGVAAPMFSIPSLRAPVMPHTETPEELANADRVLTPAEQKIVDDWQSKQADAMAEAEEAKGGPKAQVVEVTPQGAVISTPKAPRVTTTTRRVAVDTGMPPWQIALIAIGGAAVLFGAYKIVRG